MQLPVSRGVLEHRALLRVAVEERRKSVYLKSVKSKRARHAPEQVRSRQLDLHAIAAEVQRLGGQALELLGLRLGQWVGRVTSAIANRFGRRRYAAAGGAALTESACDHRESVAAV